MALFFNRHNVYKKHYKKEYKNKIDIIVTYNYPSIALLKLLSYCKNYNIKIISDITEWYQPKGNFIFKIIKGLDSFLRMRILNKKNDGLILISTHLYDYYQNINKIQLPPLVDKKSPKWKKSKLNNDNFINIVYAGSLGNGQKDRLDYVISSLLRIKDHVKKFKFSIIGITKDDYLSVFGSDSVSDSMLNVINFEGRLSHERTIEKISSADYFIFLRNNNILNKTGFPTKFVESISCGTPVLTNTSSNIIDFLEDGELGFIIDISSEQSIDKSLKKALNLKAEKISDMKDRCISFNKFHYEYYQKVFQEFLNNL